MAIREILQLGDSRLTQVSNTIQEFDDKLYNLIIDLTDTLNSTSGVGISAPQIGELYRVVVIKDIETGETYDIINPTIIDKSGEQTDAEGCLSYKGKFGIVTRPMNVRVQAQNSHGETSIIEASGLLARILSHEIDHLDGHMYTEYVQRYLTEEEIQARKNK